MKKKYIIVGVLLIVIILIIVVLINNKINEKPELILKGSMEVERFSEITNYYGIETVKNGKIITKEESLDTSEVGEIEINLVLENNYGKRSEAKYYIGVKNNVGVCELSFRDSEDNLLMIGDVIKNKGASITEDASGNPAILLIVRDKAKLYEVTESISKKEDNTIVIWKDFDESSDSYEKEKAFCGNGKSKCLSSAVVSQGFASDIIIVGSYSQDEVEVLIDCINNSLK